MNGTVNGATNGYKYIYPIPINSLAQVPTAVCGRIVCHAAAKFIFCRSLQRYRATWDYTPSHGDELELTRVRELEFA